MRFFSTPRPRLLIYGLFTCCVLASAVFCVSAQEENAKDTQAKGMPPRTAPTEYQAQAQVGTVEIGAEFTGHALPTPDQTVDSEDFVVVEAGFFGPPGAHT